MPLSIMTKPGSSPATDGKKPTFKTIADNRRARHEYEVLEVFEAGIVLAGTEVKSIRQGKANLKDSFAKLEQDELWLYNCHISAYDHGNRFNHDPVRKRKLLMHRKQILKLKSRVQEKGLTLVPLKLYLKRNWVKVDLAVARGRQLYDKRQVIAKKENRRQLERVVKQMR
jgi:SsrA-binding protein